MCSRHPQLRVQKPKDRHADLAMSKNDTFCVPAMEARSASRESRSPLVGTPSLLTRKRVPLRASIAFDRGWYTGSGYGLSLRRCLAKKSSMSLRFSGLLKPGPPCPLPLTTTSLASTPAFFRASASTSL